jgi:plasmid stabilization system protein ParE
LIDYTPAARRQVGDLIDSYCRKHRPEAVRNLDAALAAAERKIAAGPARPRLFPSVYRDLARPGRAWLKEGIYWIAYQQTVPPAIVAVFWEQAEIDRRYPAMG